jgi:hypothetical protein
MQELMDSQGEELTSGELMETNQERIVEEAKDSSHSETEESARILTKKGMAEAFQHLQSFLIFETMSKTWTEAHRLPEVWRMLPIATGCSIMKRRKPSPVVFGFFLQQKGIAWHSSKTDLLLN